MHSKNTLENNINKNKIKREKKKEKVLFIFELVRFHFYLFISVVSKIVFYLVIFQLKKRQLVFFILVLMDLLVLKKIYNNNTSNNIGIINNEKKSITRYLREQLWKYFKIEIKNLQILKRFNIKKSLFWLYRGCLFSSFFLAIYIRLILLANKFFHFTKK